MAHNIYKQGFWLLNGIVFQQRSPIHDPSYGSVLFCVGLEYNRLATVSEKSNTKLFVLYILCRSGHDLNIRDSQKKSSLNIPTSAFKKNLPCFIKRKYFKIPLIYTSFINKFKLFPLPKRILTFVKIYYFVQALCINSISN